MNENYVLDRCYVLGRALGEGGMGSVHLATRRTDGGVVALKLVANGGALASSSPEPEPWLAIAREFEILSSLHHPNVVRVLDYGFDERLGPYFTMEYLPDAADLLTAGRDAPLPKKIDYLTQLLRALAYMHRRGIIHRDIKPSNVLCVNDTVKLLDFGVATVGPQVRKIAGTRPYMAPELLCGGPPSVRSDLYAFGVLAGALLAGWSSASPGCTTRVTEVRAPEEPAAPRQELDGALVLEPGGVYAALDQMLAKLCAQRAEERYASAGEVLADLGRAVGRDLPLDTSETRESFLQASEFVGREREMRELKAALEAAVQGQGSGYLVSGESGVGKSRLVLELETLAMVRGVHVAHGQALAEGSSSYEVWLPALRASCLQANLPEETLAVLKELLPELPSVLGQAVADPPKLALPAARARLSAAVIDVFRRQAKPTLLVLEDLQWAGADSVSLLAELSHLLPELRLMVVVNYRSDEAPELAQALPALRMLGLSRLGRQDVTRLSTSMLGPRGARRAFVDYLCRETEGNPFFLVEVVRALAEQAGQLDQVHRAELPEGLLTGGIERIVQRRVSRVPAEYLPLLEVAAAVGRRLDLRLLVRLAGPVDVESWLLTCANAAVLESRTGEWRFAHDKLREALLARMTGERRLEVHRAIVDAAEQVFGGIERGVKSAALAHYAEQAGDAVRAAAYNALAADVATRRCSYLVVRKHYASALEQLAKLSPDAERTRARVDLLLKQVYVSMVSDPAETNLARMADAKRALEALSARGAPGSEDRLRLARTNYLLGRIHFYRGDTRQAVAHYRDVLPAARESGDDELLALPTLLIGIALAMQGKMYEAEPLLYEAISPLERLGEPFEWFRAVGYRGFTLIALGRIEEGRRELERVHGRARDIEQPSLSSAAHLMRGSAAILLSGEYEDGLEDMREVLRLATQTGDKLHLSLAHSNSACALAQLGRLPEARAERAIALELANAMGSRLMLADWYEAADAELALCAGDLGEARERAHAVSRASSGAEQLASLGVAERVLAEVSALEGEQGRAEAHFAESLRAFESGGVLLQAARTYARRAMARRRAKARAAAEEDIETALELLAGGGAHRLHQAVLRAYRDD